MWHEPIRNPLCLYLVGCLSEGQGFGLGENVRQQHVMVAAQSIEWFVKGNEITGDESGALMDQLVEGMLSVGSRLAPVDSSRIAGHRFSHPA